jgi:DNA-binding transcriptional LysR family regulator
MIATPTEIEHFLEIFRTKHISNAAVRLGITQPTLTQSLQKIESKLNVSLFIRTKQGVLATEAGRAFYTRALALQENWEGLQTEVHKLKNEISGKYKLGCHPAVGGYTLPPLLRSLNTEAPGIELAVTHDSSRMITERLISYEIDLAYVINPSRHRDLILVKLGEDQVTFWKKKGLSKPPERIFADQSLTQTESLLSKVHKKHFRNWQVLQSSSLELIRTLTLEGQGIGILPARTATSDSKDLVPYDETLPIFHDEIYLAYRKEILSHRSGKELIRLAKVKLS